MHSIGSTKTCVVTGRANEAVSLLRLAHVPLVCSMLSGRLRPQVSLIISRLLFAVFLFPAAVSGNVRPSTE